MGAASGTGSTCTVAVLKYRGHGRGRARNGARGSDREEDEDTEVLIQDRRQKVSIRAAMMTGEASFLVLSLHRSFELSGRDIADFHPASHVHLFFLGNLQKINPQNLRIVSPPPLSTSPSFKMVRITCVPGSRMQLTLSPASK